MKNANKILIASRGGKSQTENFEKCEFYRGKIIEMVERIEDTWILKEILQFIVNMTKED